MIRGRRRAGAVVAAAILVLAACAGTDRPATPARTATASDGRTAGPAVARTREAIALALGGRSVQLQDPPVPYRPAEPAALAAVPRAVYQAVLPADPAHGYIVVFDLPDEAAARAAAEAQAAYVGSPVGRVQFPTGTRFIVRQLGSTVIFYADPPDSPDDQAPDVADALRALGTEITVPS
jgi:hypothetical protein